MSISFTVDGVAETSLIDWSITASMNNPHTLRCRFYSAAGTFRPALRQEVIVLDGATKIFGGYITAVEETGDGYPNGTPIATDVTATDYTQLAQRRYVNETIPAGTLKAALVVVTSYLAAYGVTLYGSQVDGPTVPELAYFYRHLPDVLGELSAYGYVCELDYDKVLRMYTPGTLSAPFNITDANVSSHVIGDISVDRALESGLGVYANRIIVIGGSTDVPTTGVADDLVEQGLYGLAELTIASPTATTDAIAAALAATLLSSHSTSPKQIRFVTEDSGIFPGRTMSVQVTKRNLNATFLITEVRTWMYGGKVLRRAITAYDGSVLKQTWRDIYRQWSGGGTTQIAAAGSVGAGRAAFFLGGLGDVWVQDGTPTWIANGSGVRVAIDPSTRGSLDATVTVWVKARSGSVQARLRNVTTNATVGTGTVITSTSAVKDSFAVSLTVGLNDYELQLLPGVANVDVNGVGYLE